jgi:hypothetical protein
MFYLLNISAYPYTNEDDEEDSCRSTFQSITNNTTGSRKYAFICLRLYCLPIVLASSDVYLFLPIVVLSLEGIVYRREGVSYRGSRLAVTATATVPRIADPIWRNTGI